MMDKVFCKNCRNYTWLGDYGIGNYCDIVNTDIVSNPVIDKVGEKSWELDEKKIMEVLKKELTDKNYWDIMRWVEECNLNNNFDCKYYKRKWWKFWLKTY